MPVLLQPVRQGRDLLDEIAATRPGPGRLAVWWLGQSGFLIRSARGTLLIDPYLSEHLTTKYAQTARPHIRMTAAPLRGADLTGIDLVLASHQHSDHLDPGTLPDLLTASPQAVLGLPACWVDHAVAFGLPADRLIGLDADSTCDRAGFHVRAIPSAHETLERDDQGRHRFLGFLIEAEGLRLYHGGDTLAYPGLTAWLGVAPLDAMFLPINGRDPARGVPGNMTAAEAVDLAAAVRTRYLIPHHYDMFTFNTVPVSEYEAEARRLPAVVRSQVLQCGERWMIGPEESATAD